LQYQEKMMEAITDSAKTIRFNLTLRTGQYSA